MIMALDLDLEFGNKTFRLALLSYNDLIVTMIRFSLISHDFKSIFSTTLVSMTITVSNGNE